MAMREKVLFYSGPGYQLSCTLNLPDDGKRRVPGVVVCPGGYGLSEMRPLPQVAEALAKEGFAALQLEYRGFGHSEGPRWRQNVMECVEDVRSALTYLETRSEVDSGKLGLWGTSYGGNVVVFAAAFDKRAKSIFLLVPALGQSSVGGRTGDELAAFISLLEEDRRNKVLTGRSSNRDPLPLMYPRIDADISNFWAATRKEAPERNVMRVPLENFWGPLDNFILTGIDVVDKISPRPICFALATRDGMYAGQKELYAKAKDPKKLLTYEGVSHHGIYDEPHMSRVVGESRKWFADTFSKP